LSPVRQKSWLRAAFALTATGAATAVLAALAPAAVASTAPTAAWDTDLRAVVSTGATSALGEVRQDGKTVWRGRAGVADLATGAAVPEDARFRIGSVTKVFLSTVVLQLVGEQRIGLDDPIERYLPGVVPNGAAITVREVLNHTSGIYNFTEDPGIDLPDEAAARAWVADGRWRDYPAADLVRLAAAHQPYFPPGQGWHYSNTDYIVAGMLIERVTGSSWRQEVADRIIRPLGLRATSMPDTSPDLPGPHIDGYFQFDTGPADVTRFNPTIAGASGAGISSTADLARFIGALLGGRLLHPAELAQMEQPAPQSGAVQYGLGLQKFDTPCGVFYGHNGSIFGYQDSVLGSADGRRQVVLALSPYGDGTPASDAAHAAMLGSEECGVS
jgi:D-alanyl-D-alanine carboxypeptidase